MHIETGLFVTGAYGIRRDDVRKALFLQQQLTSNIDDDDDFWSVQAGIERKFIELGKTTLYGEYWQANTGAGISGRGSDATYRFVGIPVIAGTQPSQLGHFVLGPRRQPAHRGCRS